MFPVFLCIRQTWNDDSIWKILRKERLKKVNDMSKVWTVWTVNDDMETLLVGIATSEEKAYEMRGRLEEEFEDAFEYQVCCMETDKITINDTDIRF